MGFKVDLFRKIMAAFVCLFVTLQLQILKHTIHFLNTVKSWTVKFRAQRSWTEKFRTGKYWTEGVD